MNYESWPRLLVVDVEGNGATPPDLVEVATLPVVAGTLDTSAAGAWLIRPPVPVTPFATRVHKLNNTDLATCPPWTAVAGEVGTTLDGAWICAHNAGVEYNVLRRHLPDWKPAGVLDTLRLARATYRDAPKHNLDTLIDHLNLDLTQAPGHRHRAPYDAYAAALVLLTAAENYPSWDALATAAVPPGFPGTPEPEAPPTLW
ncbi:3'-5' exonuclease [Streptomyces sp. SBT349]|uniref:3'-5' exonuclease n=1 Tax=Streptomyces sp. SBT349 TaxID=1580539 RepID=UPI00066CF527|nr:3'-5' exonuclease [Streptomyces sp. SBT349]